MAVNQLRRHRTRRHGLKSEPGRRAGKRNSYQDRRRQRSPRWLVTTDSLLAELEETYLQIRGKRLRSKIRLQNRFERTDIRCSHREGWIRGDLLLDDQTSRNIKLIVKIGMNQQ